MSQSDLTQVPQNYVRIEGSERRPSRRARRIGPTDGGKPASVTIVLRRRLDAEPLPDPDAFLVHPALRPRLSQRDFAKKYGASDEDLKAVVDFVKAHGLDVKETHAARRTVVATGSVAAMSKAFAVDLADYEHEVTRGHGEKPRTERYRGRDGFIHVPAPLEPIIVGVFGLDQRRIVKRNADGDPPNTSTLSVEKIAQLYNFPTNSAAGQTIGIFSEAGYDSSDISDSFGGSPPTVTDVTVDASNDGSLDLETTQDIVIAAKAAPGASIAVYFSTYDQQGWVDFVHRVAHPNPGDPVCSVVSSSFYVSDGDDADTLSSEGVSTSWLTAVSQAFQDAAIQGVTICIASGDTGSDSKVGDGNAHVQYPASDPWVLSVGGTTIGDVNGSSFTEYVWNDTWGATGGGISDFFGLPSYQVGAGVPQSLNAGGRVGRGVPDVAANASPNAGYTGITLGGSDAVGNGTSASSPLWAGLIAVINAALGVNVGFVNPALYALGPSGFRDLTGSEGPSDNSDNGVSGYPADAAWDACTGWGSPDGTALLASLRAVYTRSLYFIVDKSTFGHDEVADVISNGGGFYSSAFWLVLEGFSISQLGSLTPTLSGAFDEVDGIAIFPDPAGPQYEQPGDFFTPQRIRLPYNVIFTAQALAAFPASGDDPVEDLLDASITLAGTTVSAVALFELVSGADPYFTNIDPSHDNAFYLSQDLRVFSAANGDAPLPGGPTLSNDNPYQFIQDLLGFLNSTPAYTSPGPDPLNALPGQNSYLTGDTSVAPLNGANQQNYNFALARVRLQDTANASADNVRVFFRLWVAPSFDTDFQPSTTYKSTLGTTGADAGRPIFPLPSGTGLSDPAGNDVQTVPFFATAADGAHDYDSTVPNANIRSIQIPNMQDKVWAYFGCFLDVYDGNNQSKFAGTHHCIVAEIAYDDAPIVNAGGVTMSPENSDKLAQRNLQITSSGNPSYPETHRIPQAFDSRPSPQLVSTPGTLLNYPDELMIDWGNTPAGSTANIYWPEVSAADVIALASKLYGVHPLTQADVNTIKCPKRGGVSYVPIPPAVGKNYAGLITVDLPPNVHVGQEFQIKVRRVTSRRPKQIELGKITVPRERVNAMLAEQPSVQKPRNRMINWRYITGTFQITIPVGGDRALLPAEETTLAVLKWRMLHMSPAYRWYPVLERYVRYIADRVKGFGGDPDAIEPSLHGAPGTLTPHPKRTMHRGKVCEVVFDCFGEFAGFVLEECCAEHLSLKCRERSIGELVLRACKERLGLAVWLDQRGRICELRVEL
jgi:hypothetical protein